MLSCLTTSLIAARIALACFCLQNLSLASSLTEQEKTSQTQLSLCNMRPRNGTELRYAHPIRHLQLG